MSFNKFLEIPDTIIGKSCKKEIFIYLCYCFKTNKKR